MECPGIPYHTTSETGDPLTVLRTVWIKHSNLPEDTSRSRGVLILRKRHEVTRVDYLLSLRVQGVISCCLGRSLMYSQDLSFTRLFST